MKKFFQFPFCLAALAVCGCMTVQTYTPEEAPEMMVIRDFAPFYTVGPQQIQGPDASLRVDARLRMLRKEFGYSYVQLEDGRLGFVPNEFFAPAPPRPSPTPTPRPSAAARRGVESADFELPPGAGFDDISLPDLQSIPGEIPPPVFIDDVEPERKPEFRL